MAMKTGFHRIAQLFRALGTLCLIAAAVLAAQNGEWLFFGVYVGLPAVAAIAGAWVIDGFVA